MSARFNSRPAPSAFGAPRRRPFGRSVAPAVLWLAIGFASPEALADGADWQRVQASAQAAPLSFDGVVESVRQTVVAAQVSGAVLALEARAGDRVRSGQVLMRLDARAADQIALAGQAQVLAARATLDAAERDAARQRQLFEQGFISRAGLDRAEAAWRSAQAQLEAQAAQAGASRTQTGLHVVRAPFDGVVAEVPVALGDMALPGRPLATVYDPSTLRASVRVPQSAARPAGGGSPRIEVPRLDGTSNWIEPVRVQWLPTLDPTTHTVELRADLPAQGHALAPGQHVRVWLEAHATPASAHAGTVLSVPRSAVVRRAELNAVYVRDAAGQAVLRQVRLGRVAGDRVEVLAGLSAGESVAAQPQAVVAALPRPASR